MLRSLGQVPLLLFVSCVVTFANNALFTSNISNFIQNESHQLINLSASRIRPKASSNDFGAKAGTWAAIVREMVLYCQGYSYGYQLEATNICLHMISCYQFHCLEYCSIISVYFVKNNTNKNALVEREWSLFRTYGLHNVTFYAECYDIIIRGKTHRWKTPMYNEWVFETHMFVSIRTVFLGGNWITQLCPLEIDSSNVLAVHKCKVSDGLRGYETFDYDNLPKIYFKEVDCRTAMMCTDWTCKNQALVNTNAAFIRAVGKLYLSPLIRKLCNH